MNTHLKANEKVLWSWNSLYIEVQVPTLLLSPVLFPCKFRSIWKFSSFDLSWTRCCKSEIKFFFSHYCFRKKNERRKFISASYVRMRGMRNKMDRRELATQTGNLRRIFFLVWEKKREIPRLPKPVQNVGYVLVLLLYSRTLLSYRAVLCCPS